MEEVHITSMYITLARIVIWLQSLTRHAGKCVAAAQVEEEIILVISHPPLSQMSFVGKWNCKVTWNSDKISASAMAWMGSLMATSFHSPLCTASESNFLRKPVRLVEIITMVHNELNSLNYLGQAFSWTMANSWMGSHWAEYLVLTHSGCHSQESTTHNCLLK